MRKAVIDIGNSFTKIFVFNEDEITGSFRFDNQLEDEILECIKSTNYHSCILSSVKSVPEYFSQLQNLLILNSSTPLPFQKDYHTPETLGNDRLALAAGAVYLFPGKKILVIDAGTCITYDFVDSDNIYRGGAIAPGLQMRLKALNTFTEKLPLVEINEKESISLIGKSTRESILSGVVRGMALEIDGMIAEYTKNYEEITVMLTGGDADYLKNHLKNEIFANLNLQAIGLNHILNYNYNALKK